MLALPWKDHDKTETELLREEVNRVLLKLAKTDPNTKEYTKLLVMYERLNSQLNEEKKIKASQRGRWIDILGTGLLAGITLTAESWTPLTSKWYNTIMRPIRGRDYF